MATLAVTIGVGRQHRTHAAESARRVRDHLGLETFIIDDSYLHYALDRSLLHHTLGIHRKFEQICSLKFSVFDIVPSRFDRVMYFDNDWRPIRDWDVDLLFPDLDTIYVTPDLVHGEEIRRLETEYGLAPGSYFNAGWMVIPRSSRSLLEEAKTRYQRLPKHHLEQCVLNQVLAGKVSYAPSAFNVLERDAWPDSANVMAVHSAGGNWNYRVYRGDTKDRNWEIEPYDDPNETILRNLDFSHESTMSSDHLVGLYQTASGYVGGMALDIGSYQGHCALALALAGLNVTSIDSSDNFLRGREGMLGRYHQCVDFRIESSSDQLATDIAYDIVLHNTVSDADIENEIEAFWNRKVKPGGTLFLHNADLLSLHRLLESISPADHVVTEDVSGRRLAYFLKPI